MSKTTGKKPPETSSLDKPATRLLVQQGFSGPLPPPSILAEYERLAPGLAERIIAMAESEAKHRHGLDEKALDADIEFQRSYFIEARIGQIFGLVIGVVAVLAGTYAAVSGSQVTGSIIGGGCVIGLVSAFLYGRKLQAAANNP